MVVGKGKPLIVWCVLLIGLCCHGLGAKPIHHYVFFGQDREEIRRASSFFETRAVEGAQVAYSWRQLEPQKDEYDFSAVREDLAFLTRKGKRLFVQLQDVTFSESRINVPRYLLSDSRYHGGADKQYNYQDGDEEHAVVAGWVSRRWDPAMRDKGYLRAVYKAARELNVGVGGPDLLPFRPGQLNHAYPLISEAAGVIPTGIAVQDGNYGDVNPKTGKRAKIPDLYEFAVEHLKVDYVFWCTQEPFYSGEVIQFLKRVKQQT